MILRALALLLLAFSIPLPTVAIERGSMTETVTLSAQAATEEKAIAKALAQAIQQVHGVEVNVAFQSQEHGKQVVINWMGNAVVLEGEEINRGATSLQAAGPVRSYRVLSSEFLAEQKLWKVTVEASISKFKSIGDDRSNLVQIAILPLRTARGSFETGKGTAPASQIANPIGRVVTDQLVASQRFRVLDRSFWPETAGEEFITRNFSGATQESVKHGQKLGADLVLVGLVERFDMEKKEKKIYGSTAYERTLQIDLSLRVIEVATSEIRWSSTIRRQMDNEEIKARLAELRQGKKISEEAALMALQEELYTTIGNEISRKLLLHFFPESDPGIEPPATPAHKEPAKTEEARPLTPGSSEKPVEWR